MTGAYEEAREFLSHVSSKREAPSLSIVIGVVQVVGTDTCSVLLSGDKYMLDGFRWLIDAYTPTVGDVVIVLRNGSDKFILGRTVDVR